MTPIMFWTAYRENIVKDKGQITNPHANNIDAKMILLFIELEKVLYKNI